MGLAGIQQDVDTERVKVVVRKVAQRPSQHGRCSKVCEGVKLDGVLRAD